MRKERGSRFLTEVETIMGKRYLEWQVIRVLSNTSYAAKVVGAEHIRRIVKEDEIYRWQKGKKTT